MQRFANALGAELDKEFPGQLNIIKKPDPRTSGRFEVTIVPANQLIHSKDTRGQGKADNAAERQKIIDQIAAYLESK